MYSVDEKGLLGIFEVDCVYMLTFSVSTLLSTTFYNSSMQFIDSIITWNVHVHITARYLASTVCNLCRGEGSADQWTNISLATDIRVQRQCYLYVGVSLKDVLTSLVNEPLVSSVHVMPIACKIWTAIALIFHTDVAEVAFNRCITTNETKEFSENVIGENEVHATSDNFKVDFNYEFLEDFQDKHSSDR